MKQRKLGPEGLEVTECGLGCWQLGGGWGNPWDDAVAQDILETAYARIVGLGKNTLIPHSPVA